MKNLRKHIALYFYLSGLMIALSLQVYAQTPAGTQIDNIGLVKYSYLNGSGDSLFSNMASIVVESWGKIFMNKTVSDTMPTIGDTVQFKIFVGYNGSHHASNVVVIDTVPKHFKNIQSSKGTVNGNIVTWNIGTVTSSTPDSIIITAVVKMLENGVYNSINTAFAIDSTDTISANTGVIIINASRTPDVSLIKQALADTLRFGDILPYKIKAINTGNAYLQNITVIDTLPQQLDFVSATDERVHFNNGVIRLQQSAMNIGDSIEFVLNTRVARVSRGDQIILNTVYLSAEVPTDSLTALKKSEQLSSTTILLGRAAAASAVVLFNPSLSISKTATKDTALVNDTLDYIITVKNTGDSPLSDVMVSDTVDSEFHTIILTSSNVTLENNIVSGSVDLLSVGDSIVAHIRTIATKKSNSGLKNTAFVQSAFTQQQSASVVVPMKSVEGQAFANMLLTKTVSRDTIINGDSVLYMIRIKNIGTVVLKNITVLDTLPQQLTKSIVLYGKGDLFGKVIMYDRDSLSVGEEDSIVVVSVVAANPLVPETITNTAYAISAELPVQQASASFISLIGIQDKLLLNMSVSASTAFTGDSLRYVLRVTNVSNRKLTNIIVRDPIPFQLENISVEKPTSTKNVAAKVSLVPMEKAGRTFSDSLRLEGTVVIYQKDTMEVGEVDSFYVRTNVRLDRPNFELILNTGYAESDQTEEIIAQAVTLIEPRTNQNFQMQLTKTVSKDTVHIGDTMSYVIRMKNITGGPLTKITIVDTLPAQLINAKVFGNAKIDGNVVIYEVGYLGPSMVDSIVITAQLRPFGLHDGELVLNYVFARAMQVEQQTAFALFTAKTDPACRIEVIATPEKIIGNGRSKAFIQVSLTNTLGYPKPDGTPVVLTTTVGEFSNGQSMRVLYSKDGKVSDSLRATIAGNNLVNAMAIASADDGQGCNAKDTVLVVFYPGAIEGIVVDNRTQQPVNGAIVRGYSLTTDSLIGTVITKEDGYYLIPVAKTDSFRVTITTVNEFGKEITIETRLTVNVSGAGDSPTPNQNSVSGAVYYLVSHEPIAATSLKILLQQITSSTPKNALLRSNGAYSVATVDSIFTDSAGTFKFDKIPEGQFILKLSHPSVTGELQFTNSGGGKYVINANIAITLNPNITFTKSGPSQVRMTDTATYRIIVKNIGNLSTTNTMVIDSLHWAMKFVNATGGGVYDAAGHRILWNIGRLDSLSERFYDVRVRFVDTLQNSTQTLNRASITSNQTTPILDSVQTLLFITPTMRVWKTSHVQSALPGDTVLYTIKLNNTAGSLADSVLISDNLPTQVEYLGSQVQYFSSTPPSPSVINDTVTYNNLAHRISWMRDTIFVGDSVTITLVTRVRYNLEPGHHTYTNIATMNWSSGVLSTENDSLSSATVRSFVTYLNITKQALRKVVEIGDIATYVVRVTNMSSTSIARDIQVIDKIPFGFRYMNGSTFIDSMNISDPTGRKELFWLLQDSLAPGASIQFVYRLIVGAGAAEGNGINTAQAFGVSQFGTPMTSAEVAERVEVRRGVFSTHGLIVGKVFYDDNHNKYQDPGEVGVKGVELMMEDGTRIITGDDGKYSVPDVLPGEHVIRVRTHTLPEDSYLEMGYNDFARDSTSRFVRLTESGIARVDFYLARNVSYPDSLVYSQAIAKIGDFSIQRISSPRNIVFIEDKRVASMKLTGLSFEVGKAVLKPESFVVLKQLAELLREYPDQPVTISGHTDSMKIATVEFPNNKILSMARAISVENYLVEKEGINVDRIMIHGYGETVPVASNKTIEGRALNRRVEFAFTVPEIDNTLKEMPMAIEIPIEYSGTETITKVDFRDILNPAFQYVEGSATFADSSVTPVIKGNELHWILTNLGQNFKYTLRYTVMVQRPDNYNVNTYTSNSSSICYFAEDSIVHCLDTLTTTNQVAIAVRGRAVNFVMSGVLFDVAKATLRSTALSSLEVTGKFLKDDPTSMVVIEGHTDSSPIRTKEFPSNIELSQARANTIREKLIANFGIASERITTAGFGENRPIATNSTSEGRQANRRIEIRVLRNEFITNMLPQGGIDSSKYVVETLLPKNSPGGIDSIMNDKSKERYILKLDIQRKIKRNTVSTTIIDTIPEGLNLLAHSVTKVRGIDSVAINGNVLIVHCSANDSLMQLYYIAEVSNDVHDETTILDDYTVRKVQSDGSSIEEKADASVIKIRKKRMLVRHQR